MMQAPQQPTGNAFGAQQPQAAPQGAPPQYAPQPGEVEAGHRSVDAVMDGLIKLVSLPKGELTKKNVFDEASTMISHGAFPTPEGKQQLIGELASLPDDEAGIRKNLGQYLLSIAEFRNHFHNAFGPPQPQGMPNTAPQEEAQQ